MTENNIHVTLKRKNKYISEYRLCPNIWPLFENWSAIFNKNLVFSEHMQHSKHTVAIYPIFETGPFWGVRDPTPLTNNHSFGGLPAKSCTESYDCFATPGL